MKISASFLSIKDDPTIKQKLKKLNETSVDYIHFDIMDGLFVPNVTWNIDEIKELFDFKTKQKDVHLMVNDVEKYIDDFISIDPVIITFHVEATKNVIGMINKIKQHNIKVGLAINPETNVKDLIPYLEYMDLVLIMSVRPGFGGQKFITNTTNKIAELEKIRDIGNYHYLIEVDGGVNSETIKFVRDSDIAVVGSYITLSDDYKQAVSQLQVGND